MGKGCRNGGAEDRGPPGVRSEAWDTSSLTGQQEEGRGAARGQKSLHLTTVNRSYWWQFAIVVASSPNLSPEPGMSQLNRTFDHILFLFNVQGLMTKDVLFISHNK